MSFPLGRFEGHNPAAETSFWHGLWTGDAAWFLPTIFFAVLLATLGRKLPLWLLFVLAAAVSLVWRPVAVSWLDRALAELPFLVAGMWVGRKYERVERVPVPAAALGAALLACSIFAVTRSELITSPFAALPLGLLGALMLFLLARCLGRRATARGLAWAGEASFGIFLISSYFQGGGRELLLRLAHVTNPYAQAVFPTLAAILIPAWIYQNRVKLRMDWMFVWPSRRT